MLEFGGKAQIFPKKIPLASLATVHFYNFFQLTLRALNYNMFVENSSISIFNIISLCLCDNFAVSLRSFVALLLTFSMPMTTFLLMTLHTLEPYSSCSLNRDLYKLRHISFYMRWKVCRIRNKIQLAVDMFWVI